MASSHWRKSPEYRRWRIAVIRRDKVCQTPGCGRKKTRHAHHIKNAQHHPELRFDPANGVTVCGRCHWAIHNLARPSYRHKTTEATVSVWFAVATLLAKLPEKPSFYK